MTNIRLALLPLAVLLLCASLAGAQEHLDYAVLADGVKIGYAEHIRTVDKGQVTNTERMNITISRAGIAMEITSEETTVESLRGIPMAFKAVQKMNGMSVLNIEGKRKSDGSFMVVSESMGTRQQIPFTYPDGALMAEGLLQAQLKQGLKPGTAGTAKVFSPALLKAAVASWVIGEQKQVDLFGRVMDLREVETKMAVQAQEITTTVYIDEKMIPYKMVMPMMGMTLELVHCDKSVARSENDVIDFFEKVTVKSPRPLTEKDRGQALVYTILPEKDAELTFVETAQQKIDPRGEKIAIIVNPGSKNLHSDETWPLATNDQTLKTFTDSARYVQSDDEKVRELTLQAVENTRNIDAAAAKIEAFVEDYISDKNLSVGYATAAEVARSKQGDCSEHAVLAAAMCRSLGIPARVVTGIIYSDTFLEGRTIFGGHAWTEYYNGKSWIAMDATRASGGGFGSGHLAMARGNGDPADFFGMINTLGYFTIEKIEPLESE